MRRALTGALAVAALVGAPTGAAAAATTVLRLDGIGPLRLGMAEQDALTAGWLAHRAPGCELASPRPITYRFTGPHAPAGLRGTAQFDGGTLTTLSFTRGVRTALGVRVGRTSPARMVARYRTAGFRASARYDATFQGTFVTVRRPNGRQVLGAFADGPVITLLAVPAVPVCE